MTSSPPPVAAVAFAAIVVAAGKGLRAGHDIPKQFVVWRGKPVLRHSVETLLQAGAAPVVIAVPAECEDLAAEVLHGIEGIALVHGGETRQESVRRALESLDHRTRRVLIHDAARPDLPIRVIDDLIAALDIHVGAIPVLPVVDSVIEVEGNTMGSPARREVLRRVQTPQAFRFPAILEAHRSWNDGASAGDDAQVLRASGGTVALVDGDERLNKLTFAEDFMEATPPAQTAALPVRIGMGYDVHRLAEGEELWLCGLLIPHDRGLAGHSDADVALHAVVDAILGAAGEGDIGEHFPPSDPQWRGAPSSRFVEHAVALAQAGGLAIGHVDVTLICEAPKIGPHKAAMRERLAQLLGVASEAVNIKATTTERLGFTGREEGIAAQAVATLVRTR